MSASASHADMPPLQSAAAIQADAMAATQQQGSGVRCTCPHAEALLARHALPVPPHAAAMPTTAADTAAGASAPAHGPLWSPSSGVTAASGLPLQPLPPPPPQPATELHALMLYAAAQHAHVTAAGGVSSRKRRALAMQSHAHRPRCHQAECAHPSRTLMACVECVHVGCWAPRCVSTASAAAAHSRQHAHDKQHSLALDLSRLTLYCFLCGDYVYHSAFEMLMPTLVRDAAARKKLREHAAAAALPGMPAAAVALVHEKARFVGQDQMAGLRGMYNLGNTCFMTVVLQSLLHNPLLRAHFLSDRHNRHRCLRRTRPAASNPGSVTPSAASSVCLACDLDELFSAFYGGSHTPFVPDHFLCSMWTHADHLAGYAQQDAHELLMAVLDGVHEGCKEGESSLPSVAAGGKCPCVVHSTFGGTLRSDVKCNTCSNISTALDAMLDISLDIVPHGPLTPLATPAATPGAPAAPVAPQPVHLTRGESRAHLSIIDCLARFTRVEKLFHKDKFFCSKCNSAEDSTKQMSLQSLPSVLCLHLKRFDHGHGHALSGYAGGSLGSGGKPHASSKVDHFVAFPLEGLDLGPYLHTSLPSPLSPALGPRTLPGDSSSSGSTSGSSSASRSSSSRYDLFCVIVHKGTLDTGHYLCYLRRGDAWFKNDDKAVSRVEASEVEAQHAYLLMYVRQQLPASALTSL